MPVLGPQHKSFPPQAWGVDADDFAVAGHTAREFQTPLLMLDRQAMADNTSAMFAWLQRLGLRLAPHGKTTMAPRLWKQLLDAGAWGLTLATGWQVQLARAVGIRRIMLANELVDPVALRALAVDLDRDDDAEFVCWADSTASVRLMTQVLEDAGARRRIDVIVELGAAGGRAGARTVETALAVADAVVASDRLRLAGVGGYEGSLAHDRGESGLAAVDGYLADLVALHRELGGRGAYESRMPIVTAGGSAYFDRVAEHLAPLTEEALVLLRSGAFQIHDDGFYHGITPMGGEIAAGRFRSAMHAWTRVISRPEPDLAILDGGKRDLPYDEGMPVARHVVGLSPDESAKALSGSRVTGLNDQHGFLRLGAAATADTLPVGSVVRLGLSHPCTAFDKWRLIPVVDDAAGDVPRVVDVVETWF